MGARTEDGTAKTTGGMSVATFTFARFGASKIGMCVTRPGASVGTVTWESDRTGRAIVRSLTQGARRMWPVGARDGAMPIASRRPRPPKGSSQGRFVRDPRSRGGAHKPLARTRRKQRERWKRGHLYSGVDNWDLRDP